MHKIPVEIFTENVFKIETETKTRMLTKNTVNQMLRRQRSKNNPNCTIMQGNHIN